MREQEMRQRVFQFLKVRMRNMLMPATLGIGLAVGGCSQSTSLKDPPDSAADTGKDTQMPIPIYAGSFGDSSVPGMPDGPSPDLASSGPEAQPDAGLPRDVPIYGSDMSRLDQRKADGQNVSAPDAAPDQAVALDGAAIDGRKPDGGPETSIVKYMAPFDAGRDAGVEAGRDAGADLGGIAPVYIAPLYMAQMSDAAPADERPAVRYLAQMPDSSVVSPLYMAPQSS